MNAFLAFPAVLLPAIAVAAAVLHAVVRRMRRRRQERREHGWRLIHELKAYSAWIDSLRGEPPASTEPEELTPAYPLRNACAIGRSHFPPLGDMMLRLLQADSELMRHLWEQKLLRLAEPGDWVPCHRNPEYRGLREAQEDLIDAIIAGCQRLIGDDAGPWRNTSVDPAFAGSTGLTTSPSR